VNTDRVDIIAKSSMLGFRLSILLLISSHRGEHSASEILTDAILLCDWLGNNDVKLANE